jgi:hypothetical protein
MSPHYPPSHKIASPSEIRRLYDELRKEVASYKESADLANSGATIVARERNKYKKEATVASRHVLTLTKKQKASDEASKSTMWSGAAAISITILYETWKVVGFPGGHQWIDWWNHEAIYGVLMWFATIIFALMHKISKD